ncbi:MAG TPA: DUF2652 domain-containing protein [Acidimicrobiia bacterium]|nr:DUF2652 domain-containing protein [Acidimicrobiia bacterium]
MENRGFVLIADITGYTVYLNESELEHAQGTLTQLLELLIEHTKPPLVLSSLEGDAVFSYALDTGMVSSQTFIEGIESAYVAFRRAIELMVLNNTCQCRACANVSSLDLKFFLHHGTFVIQRIGGDHQLVGTDVNLIHRLLKNSVKAATGIGAYFLCTEAAVAALGMDPATQGMVRHEEAVADLGRVTVWIKDVHPVYQAKRGEALVSYTPREVLGETATELKMPPELVWDYLNQSEFRNLLIRSDSYQVIDRQAGNIAPGSTYQCYHGKMLVPQLVVEWRPFERVLLSQRIPFKGRPTEVLIDFQLTPTPSGTLLTETVARLTGPPLQRVMARLMIRSQRQRSQASIEEFRDAVQADLASRRAEQPIIVPGA